MSSLTPRLVPADAFPAEELAALFTRGYEDYFVPIEVDEAAMAAFIEAWDIDLGRSRVALMDDQPWGLPTSQFEVTAPGSPATASLQSLDGAASAER